MTRREERMQHMSWLSAVLQLASTWSPAEKKSEHEHVLMWGWLSEQQWAEAEKMFPHGLYKLTTCVLLYKMTIKINQFHMWSSDFQSRGRHSRENKSSSQLHDEDEVQVGRHGKRRIESFWSLIQSQDSRCNLHSSLSGPRQTWQSIIDFGNSHKQTNKQRQRRLSSCKQNRCVVVFKIINESRMWPCDWLKANKWTELQPWRQRGDSHLIISWEVTECCSFIKA